MRFADVLRGARRHGQCAISRSCSSKSRQPILLACVASNTSNFSTFQLCSPRLGQQTHGPCTDSHTSLLAQRSYAIDDRAHCTIHTHTWQANELSTFSRRAQAASKQICSAKIACKYSTADVIKQLKIPLKQLPNPEEARRLAHMHEWRVLVVHPDCRVEEKIQTAENLGLAPRDTSLFAAQPAGMSAQRATIMPRDARAHVDRAVLVRTEIARAIIRQDSAILFPCRSGVRTTYKKCTCT